MAISSIESEGIHTPEFFLYFLAGVSFYLGTLTGVVIGVAAMHFLKPKLLLKARP